MYCNCENLLISIACLTMFNDSDNSFISLLENNPFALAPQCNINTLRPETNIKKNTPAKNDRESLFSIIKLLVCSTIDKREANYA